MPVPRLPLLRAKRGVICALCLTSLLLVSCASAPDSPSSDSTNASATNSSTATARSSSATATLSQLIAGIDAAVYAYGVVGAHLSGATQRQALRAITTLDRQRAGFETALGSQVDEAAVAYVLPGPVTDANQAKALAELLEMKLIPLFDQVAGATTGATHALAANASRKAALRAQNWQPSSAPANS